MKSFLEIVILAAIEVAVAFPWVAQQGQSQAEPDPMKITESVDAPAPDAKAETVDEAARRAAEKAQRDAEDAKRQLDALRAEVQQAARQTPEAKPETKPEAPPTNREGEQHQAPSRDEQPAGQPDKQASGQKPEAAEVHWLESYDEGREQGKRLGRPLFVDFETQGCVYCRQLKAEVYEHPDAWRKLRAEFVPVWYFVPAERRIAGANPDPLVRFFGITVYPRAAIVWPDGTWKVINPERDARSFLAQLDREAQR